MIRPTTLRLFASRCPKAVDYYEAGAFADRSVFAVGTAAHDVLHAIALYPGNDAAIEHATRALIEVGRVGIDAEPPLPPDAVFAGRDIAVKYAANNPVPDGAIPELGLAFRRDWTPVDYDDPAAWLGCRLDLAFASESIDEMAEGVGVVARDYKSSWSADESLLDSVQMRVQAIALLATPGAVPMETAPDFVRREIANIRSGRIYSVETWLPDEAADVDRWRRDVEIVADAMAGPRVARPGVACVGCDYATICPAAKEIPTTDRINIARAYAAAHAKAKALEELARAACDEDAIDTGDGLVGYVATTKREAIDGAGAKLWAAFAGDGLDAKTDGLARGFLAALDWTGAMVKAAAFAVHPPRTNKAARDALIDSLLTTVPGKTFTIKRKE